MPLPALTPGYAGLKHDFAHVILLPTSRHENTSLQRRRSFRPFGTGMPILKDWKKIVGQPFVIA
jgi:hypothetical protein